MPEVIRAADLFCGAGGTSEGLARACAKLGLGLDLLAVNHWDVAVATHSGNHPQARHLCMDLEAVNPREVVPEGRLQLMVASPECTHHSRARGGKPVSDQKRASAWHILRWAEAIYVESILIENVEEFREWGPIGADNRPLKSKMGETYQAFLGALRSLGYRVEDRVLNAADYGDPTTRRRLFIMARRGNRRIVWPEPTHSRAPNLFTTERWRPAREIIDWTIPGTSIFHRKRPLAPATVRRIIAGLERFGGPELEPFLVILRGTGNHRSVDDPLPAITAGGNHVGLVQPFTLQQQSGGAPRSVEHPLGTVAAKGAISLVSPYLVPFYGERAGQGSRSHSVDQPVPTLPAANKFGLCQPFLHQLTHGGRAHSVDRPVPTITTANRGEIGVVQPFLVANNSGNAPKPMDHPVPSITTSGRVGIAWPFLTRFNGNGGPVSVENPLPTVTAKDRYGLVQPVIDGVALDVTFRMLQPHELAAAMGFPASYRFTGTRTDQIRQIGNAVCVSLATALCMALLGEAGTVAEVVAS